MGSEMCIRDRDRLMSDHIDLEEINEGFEKLSAGATVRQVIMFK